MWYYYYQRINKTKYLDIIDHDKIFLLNAFLEKQYNKIKVIKNRLNYFAIESNCPPFFPNNLNDKENTQITMPINTQPTFQVHFPTFGQDHNSIKDLQEFLDQFENAIKEAKINPFKYRQRLKACLGGNVLNFVNESVPTDTSWKEIKKLID